MFKWSHILPGDFTKPALKDKESMLQFCISDWVFCRFYRCRALNDVMTSGKIYERKFLLNDVIVIFMNECVNTYDTIKYSAYINANIKFIYSSFYFQK